MELVLSRIAWTPGLSGTWGLAPGCRVQGFTAAPVSCAGSSQGQAQKGLGRHPQAIPKAVQARPVCCYPLGKSLVLASASTQSLLWSLMT